MINPLCFTFKWLAADGGEWQENQKKPGRTPASVTRHNGMTFVDFADDRPSGFRPDEWHRGLVVIVNIRSDSAFQSRDATERAASNPTTRDFGKKALHRVEPGRTGRCEMHAVARMVGKPLFDFRVLMRRVVVHDQVNGEFFGTERSRCSKNWMNSSCR